MSADSLFGGGTDLSDIVDQESLDLINKFLTDTVGGSSTIEDVGGGTLVTGDGEDGEKQGALLPGGSAIVGTINNGTLKLEISLPKGLGFVFAGLDNVTADEVGSFLYTIVNSYVPPGVNDTLRDSLFAAVDDLIRSIKALGLPNLLVRVVDFINEDSGDGGALAHGRLAIPSNEVNFTGSSDGDELFAFNLRNLSADEILVIKGVENAIVSGDGAVRVEGNIGARISSDSNDQLMIGGGGNDTLIGGGGHDTLTGGEGDDIFAFSRLGYFVITDFDTAHDSFTFKIPGVTNVQELLEIVTDATQTSTGVTFEFGAEGSITLVGVSADDLTADMVKFTF